MQMYIEGHHVTIPPELRTWLEERLEALNEPHDEIVHVRVTLEKNQRHLQGADAARVVLTLPGKMLTAAKTAKTLDQAANAVMDAITRELRAFREQRRNVVKEPGPRPRGRIVRLFPDRGYGFIETEGQREVYFHAKSVNGIAFEDLNLDMVVDLDIEAGEAGPQAARVTPYR